MRLVARVVHARDRLRHAVALLGDLTDDQVVLVVSGQGDDEVGRAADAGALEHVELGRVALLDLVLELSLELREPVRALLDQRHLVTHADEAARDVGAGLAATCDEGVHLRRRFGRLAHPRHLAGADGLGEGLDRRLRGADSAQAELLVEVGARRVEHADDHALDVEALLRHLADDEVRVVAVRRHDDRVRLLDPRLAQDVDVHAVADDEAAVPVAPEPRQRLLLLVDRDDIPAFAVELQRDRRADAAASDDQDFHGLSVALFYGAVPSPSRTPCGKATSSLASASEAAARSSASESSASSGWSSGTWITYRASTLDPRSCASFTAVATISSPISPSFIGTRIRENVASGSTCSSAERTGSSRPAPRSRRTMR